MNDSLTGSQIAGYRVERVLGRGGMASVYFAWDTKNNRPVALKVMDERYRDTPSYVDRFIHEAQTIASWDHPNIVRVYDAGEETGIYYYAMEFIRGLDLAQLLRQYLDAGQLMPYNEVVRLGWAVASALDYAHARGIIHRDVKPSNVLISVDGRVLLSDFGLVMDINRGTMGETFGSPAYMAPEQARSSAGAVPQSDNYSLGIMLYEMLTGMVPFHDSSPTALALKHLNEEPPRPRMLNARLSPAVEAVLLRALRKRPDERYATGREMMLALEHALGPELSGAQAGVPMPASPDTQVLRTQQAQAMPRIPADEAATAVGLSGGTAVRSQPVPPQNMPPGATVYTGQPRVYPSSGPATSVRPAGPPGGYAYNNPSYGAPPPPPPPARAQRRSGGFGRGLGCLVALLALAVIAVFANAAFNNLKGGLSLPAILSQLPLPMATNQPAPTRPAPPPSPTPVPPTATATAVPPSATPEPTKTPLPPTATATTAPSPTATAVAVTNTPEPVYRLAIAYHGTDGIILINTGDQAMPLPPLQLRDSENNLMVKGASWQQEPLQPGQCVAAWEKGGKPSLPKGVDCQPTGRVLYPSSKFWTKPFGIFYNNIPVAVCLPNNPLCEFDTSPKQ